MREHKRKAKFYYEIMPLFTLVGRGTSVYSVHILPLFTGTFVLVFMKEINETNNGILFINLHKTDILYRK